MPKLPGGIKKFKEAVQWFLAQPEYQKPKVTALTEIYQATNSHYPKKGEFSGEADVSGGVCQGMALEWIKKNGLSGGADAFRKEVASDWDAFAASQVSISHAKRCIKQLQAGLDKRRDAVEKEIATLQSDIDYGKETGLLASTKHFFSAPKTSQEIRQNKGAITQKLSQLESEQNLLVQDAETMYINRVFETTNPTGKFEKLSSGLSLSQIGPTIQGDQGKHPAYYMINMGGDQSSSGHCVALHAAYRPRFLDANGCEFQCDSMVTLYSFLSDYWQIYQVFGYSKASLYRFDIRLTHGPVATRMLEFANRQAVMQQLPKSV